MKNLQIRDLLDGINQFAPFGLAESWDNVGLLIGSPDREVHTLFLGLDPTLSLLQEAVSKGADTLITHHPIIFRPLSSINIATPDGAFLEKALAEKINVIACHTNFDSAAQGVSDALAACLQLLNLQPLRAVSYPEMDDTGHGRIGSYSEPVAAPAFLQRVCDVLGVDGVQVAGKLPEQITTVALCGGSGSDLAEEALLQGADVYLSAEIKHSTARWAEDAGFCVIDGTHYGTEQPAIALLAEQLSKLSRESGWNLEVLQTESEQAPFQYIKKQ